MRITYRQLVEMMNAIFTDEQWDSDVTVEDGINDECFAAELRICDNSHDSLDYNHPVIFVNDRISEENVATEKEVKNWIKAIKAVDDVKCDFETAKYNAEYIISLAEYYIQNSLNAIMTTSSELCYYIDAISLFEKGNYKDAGIKALKSLAYTIGIGHPDYIICKAKTE
jgi:hypothetical protein